MKLLYVTETLPWGRGESFFYPEIKELIRRGVDLRVLPTFPGTEIFHREGREILGAVLDVRESKQPVPSSRPARVPFFYKNLRHLVLGKTPVLERAKKVFKNIRLLSRAEDVLGSLGEWRPDHIHVQWANYTASLGWILSKSLKVPWSFTAHRYDLLYDNLLLEKSADAKFVRITSEQALRLTMERRLISASANNIVAYMGVEIPLFTADTDSPNEPFIIAVPAALIKRKGHSVLLRSLSALSPKLLNSIRVRFYGDGPEKENLLQECNKLNLNDVIEFKGSVPHKELLGLYACRKVDCVVLPSLNFGEGLGEGIPFSLIEAMAYKLPVITTRTGGSPELLGDGAGLLVSPGDDVGLADAIRTMIVDVNERKLIAQKGFVRVSTKFSVQRTTDDLLDLIAGKQIQK